LPLPPLLGADDVGGGAGPMWTTREKYCRRR
jgi:hypothetical protein